MAGRDARDARVTKSGTACIITNETEGEGRAGGWRRMSGSGSPAAALRRHQTEVRRLLRSGFTKYALLKTAHEAWREDGRGE